MTSITVPTHFTRAEARTFSRLIESFIDFLMEFDHLVCDHYDLWREEMLDALAHEHFEEELDSLLNEAAQEAHDSSAQNPPNAWNDDDVPW